MPKPQTRNGSKGLGPKIRAKTKLMVRMIKIFNKPTPCRTPMNTNEANKEKNFQAGINFSEEPFRMRIDHDINRKTIETKIKVGIWFLKPAY